MTPKTEAAVLVALTQGGSDRAIGKKLGLSKDSVRRIRIANASMVTAARAHGAPEKMLSWLDKAEAVLGKCVDYLGECAEVPLAERTPQHIHAMMGGTKILVDAITQWSAFGVKEKTSARRDPEGDAAAEPGQSGPEVVSRPSQEQPANVTPLFDRASGE